jgi:outer membrane protein TolC
LDKAKLALREQMGIEDHFEYDVDGQLPALFDPMLLAPENLVSKAMVVNPDVLSFEAASDAAAARASSSRGQRWPSIRLNAGYTRSVNLRSYDALRELNPQNTNLSFGLGINWSLFTGFQTSAAVVQADVDARNADESLRQGRLRVDRSVRSALIDVQNASRSLESARISSDLNRERVRLAEERFAIGAVPFSTLQQYVDISARADRLFVTAEFAFASSVVSMDEAVGERIRP